MSKTNHTFNRKRYVVLRGFLAADVQQELIAEVLACHYRNAGVSPSSVLTGESSLRLELGIATGGSLDAVLPQACARIREAFRQASCETVPKLRSLSADSTPLTGISLLYGPESVMKSHYDSPTQPGQRDEWLAMLSIGNPVLFRCNERIETLNSGDALVMDSMAVLHGVEGIVPIDGADFGLPVQGSRLGILMWRARSDSAASTDRATVSPVDGLETLFQIE